MKKENFDVLLQSTREAVEIRHGRLAAARRTRVEAINTRKVRISLGLSQTEFASFLGVSVYTVRNWEQGKRAPEGPARALLRIVATNPAALRPAAEQPTVMPLKWGFQRPAHSMTTTLRTRRSQTFGMRGYEDVTPRASLQGGDGEPTSLAA